MKDIGELTAQLRDHLDHKSRAHHEQDIPIDVLALAYKYRTTMHVIYRALQHLEKQGEISRFNRGTVRVHA